MFFLTAVPASAIFAQCEAEPAPATTGTILTTLTAVNRAGRAAEYLLTIKAGAGGASWEKRGAEAAVLTVFVDGRYNQDVILFAGAKAFAYRALLGPLETGEHEIAIAHNPARSAPNAGPVKLEAAFAGPLEVLPGETARNPVFERLAARNAPLIYLRPETVDKFSDIPLLTYYEIFDEPDEIRRVRYTTIFTNEDGGTRSAALMARWGRMTDIEWVYEIRVRASGEILSEIYQGANHETKDFRGRRFGAHPLLFDATVNNNFADAGCSRLRVSPPLVRAFLPDKSRETVMDAFPWTYRIMAEEARREGRIDPARLDANTIADPRDYFYLEIRTEPEGAAVSVALENGSEKSLSDFGDPRLRVERPGFVRIAVRRPAGLKKKFPDAVELVCSELSAVKKGTCRNLNLLKIVRLDRAFAPREKKLAAAAQTVETGQKARFKVE